MFEILKLTILVLFLVNLTMFVSLKDVQKKEKPQVMPPESAKIRELRRSLDSEIENLSSRITEMIDWMYCNPEPGFMEFNAAKMLVEELKKYGFEVEMGVPGLSSEFDGLKLLGGLPSNYSGPPGIPTAFKAKYKGNNEHPIVGFAVEYDALRGNPPFHGCQHNMQGPTGIGAAIALAKVAEKNNIPGSIWVIGTAAEEVNPCVKAVMAETGYLDGIDFMIRSHGTSTRTLRAPGGYGVRHILAMEYTFTGKPSHAQQAWNGISALDAVLLLFHGVDMLREHSQPQFRFHGIVTDGGKAANIVPQSASASFWIRHIMDATREGSMSPRMAKELITKKVEQIDNIAKGAALATGTIVDIEHYGECVPGISVGILNDLEFQYAGEYGGINIGDAKMAKCWEETGFASLKVPGVWATIGTDGIPEIAGHSQESADVTISPEGHKSAISTAKVMAAVHLRLLMEPEVRRKAKEEHEKWLKEYNK